MDFQDKKVVITGAAGVYGSGLGKAFAEAGALLCLSDIRKDALDSLARRLGLPEQRVLLHRTELTDEGSIGDLIETVVHAWGAPDIVVNNAGIYPFEGLLETETALWDRVMDINLRAPFLIMQGFARAMLDRGVKGCFVNVSSAAADFLRANGVPYCVSKRGLEWLTKGFALQLAGAGIRCNAVRPGFAFGGAGVEFPPGYAEAITEAVPMKRLSKPTDLADAVMFLASERASFITGETLAADGGASIMRRTGAASEARR